MVVDGPTSIDDLIAQIEQGVNVPLEDGREVCVRGVLVKHTAPTKSDVREDEFFPTYLRRASFGAGRKTSSD